MSEVRPSTQLAQDGASTNDVLTWNGTEWIGQAPAGGGGGTSIIAVLRQTVAQSIPNSTVTAALLDTEDVDTDGGHSTTVNTSRYTAQTAGWYAVITTGAFAANATGERLLQIQVNGSTVVTRDRLDADTTGSAPTDLNASAVLFLNVNDYVEIALYQNSGGALNTVVSAGEATCRMSVDYRHA